MVPSERQLLTDQATVAEITLSSNDWITSIEGRAGAAKTTTVEAIREFAEGHGYAGCWIRPYDDARSQSPSEAGRFRKLSPVSSKA